MNDSCDLGRRGEGMVRIFHGANDGAFWGLEGVPVSVLRNSLVDAFNIPDLAIPFVNGQRVRCGYRLRGGDVLEFLKPWGRKAGEQRAAGLVGSGPLLTLTEAAKLIPGRREGSRVSVRTVWRWCLRGVRGGIRLKSVLVGGQRHTTEQWVRDFIEALNPPGNLDPGQPVPFRTPLQRKRESEQAAEELKNLWKKGRA